jgi:predicted small integral membrane protein
MSKRALSDPNELYHHSCQEVGHARVIDRVSVQLQEEAETEDGTLDVALAIQALSTAIINDDVAKLRVTAARGDWLYCQFHASLFVNRLLWLAMIGENSLCDLGSNHWSSLQQARLTASAAQQLMAVVEPSSHIGQADAVVSIALDAIDSVTGQYSKLEIDDYERKRLQWLRENPTELHPEIGDLATLRSALDRVVASLTQLPSHVGVLVTGSCAASYRMDEYSDIDLHCLCTIMPTDQERDQMLERIRPRDSSRMDSFEWLGLKGTDVHLLFNTVEEQKALFQRVFEEGDQGPASDWQNDGYALSPYGWAFGRIASDPKNVLREFTAQANAFPPRLRDTVVTEWSAVWRDYAARVDDSLTRDDLISAFTALVNCNEAVFRVALAVHGVHCTPGVPKWLPVEFRQVAEPTLSAIEADIGDLGNPGTLREQFDQACQGWNAVSKHA